MALLLLSLFLSAVWPHLKLQNDRQDTGPRRRHVTLRASASRNWLAAE